MTLPTVFLIDDDEELLSILADVLSRKFDVHSFTSPNSLIQGVDSQLPDVVVADYNMPGLNGLELAQTLFRAECHSPVILYSGQVDKDLAMKAAEQGCFSVLEKPLSYERIEREIFRAVQFHFHQNINREFHEVAHEFIEMADQLLARYRQDKEASNRILKELGLIDDSETKFMIDLDSRILDGRFRMMQEKLRYLDDMSKKLNVFEGKPVAQGNQSTSKTNREK